MQQVGRLALREEGQNWVAYYALPDSMEQPIFLGSIRLSAVKKSNEIKEAFMDVVRAIVSDIIEGETGIKPEWGGPVSAPEHERSGNA